MEAIIWIALIFLFVRFLKNKPKHRRKTRKTSTQRTSPQKASQERTLPQKAHMDESDQLLLQARKLQQLEKQYRPALRKHALNEEKINQLYSIAHSMDDIHSDVMEKVISMCIEDLKLAPDVIRYQKEWDMLQFHELHDSYYFSTFKRLAIIYEKQKRYQDAIEVCEGAIALDATNDGTDGGMQARLARLKKKLEKSTISIA